MYKCKHFKIHELVPKEVYRTRGEKAWSLLDSRALETLDKVREFSGSLTVNNWFWKGNRMWSGLRTPESPYYRLYSQHTYGRAFDCVAREKTAQELREHILSHQEDFPYIRGLELDVSWLHFDVGNREGSGIVVFNP